MSLTRDVLQGSNMQCSLLQYSQATTWWTSTKYAASSSPDSQTCTFAWHDRCPLASWSVRYANSPPHRVRHRLPSTASTCMRELDECEKCSVKQHNNFMEKEVVSIELTLPMDLKNSCTSSLHGVCRVINKYRARQKNLLDLARSCCDRKFVDKGEKWATSQQNLVVVWNFEILSRVHRVFHFRY